ncbi:hypothetical protein [Chromobacterium violaceum]|uniref:hypothetical protein n=1 Tax=Chromobacterium violaceum TaxID=536 RepID=UPI001056C449|nr:hypothetical protein [Chromobacterium violaceum]
MQQRPLPFSRTTPFCLRDLETNKSVIDIATHSQSFIHLGYIGQRNQCQLHKKITPRHSALQKKKPVHINRHHEKKIVSNLVKRANCITASNLTRTALDYAMNSLV